MECCEVNGVISFTQAIGGWGGQGVGNVTRLGRISINTYSYGGDNSSRITIEQKIIFQFHLYITRDFFHSSS
ncbi:hypothetical protein [Bacteroides hominis]|uniref:hypothetical protein n=1 Tax=Bacteroides hominis TaxID=2763023 RepID=UPI003D6B5C8E